LYHICNVYVCVIYGTCIYVCDICDVHIYNAPHRELHGCTQSVWSQTVRLNSGAQNRDSLKILQQTAIPCNALPHPATHCSTPPQAYLKLNCAPEFRRTEFRRTRQTATHCNTLLYTATHCCTLQHTALYCNTLQHTAAPCNALQHTTTHLCGTKSCA